MQDTTLSRALLRETVFTEAFDAPWAVATSPNGYYWAAGSRRGGVRVWREGGKILDLAWQAHTAAVQALTFSPDGRTLATGSWDGAIKLWDLENGALFWMGRHSSSIQSLVFAPDGRLLASCGDDGAITLWNLHSGEYLHTLRRDRPYERLDITGIKGVTEAQKATLRALGAFEETSVGE